MTILDDGRAKLEVEDEIAKEVAELKVLLNLRKLPYAFECVIYDNKVKFTIVDDEIILMISRILNPSDVVDMPNDSDSVVSLFENREFLYFTTYNFKEFIKDFTKLLDDLKSSMPNKERIVQASVASKAQ